MICVVIDMFIPMVYLILTEHAYRATDVAELAFGAVYKSHGLPERMHG